MSEPLPHTADGGERSPGARAEDGSTRGRKQADASPRSPTDDRAQRRATGRGGRSAEPGSRARPSAEPVRPEGEPAEPVRRPGRALPVAQRSLLASVLGVAPWAAVGVAAGLTTIGVAVDLLRLGNLGLVFTVCYVTGCVLATAWVRRSGLFWPMVTPPLLMALAVPVVVLLAGNPRPGAGIAQRLLVIGAPLVNGFPIMAWTTGLVLVLGVFRLVTQRPVRPARAAARAGGRTSASPRRS